jgi:hypothetical protein
MSETPTTTAQPEPQAEPTIEQPAAEPANPLKDVEAKVARRLQNQRPSAAAAKATAGKGKAAAKPAAKPAPAPRGETPKFTEVFTRTFTTMLEPHGFSQTQSPDPAVVVFAKNGIRVAITNPSRPGGSKFAPYVVVRKGGKGKSGEGRDALADELRIPHFVR